MLMYTESIILSMIHCYSNYCVTLAKVNKTLHYRQVKIETLGDIVKLMQYRGITL